MPSTKSLVPAANGLPAQNYNPNTGQYEESYGSNNAAHLKIVDDKGNPISSSNRHPVTLLSNQKIVPADGSGQNLFNADNPGRVNVDNTVTTQLTGSARQVLL